MATHKSAEKRARQTIKKTAINSSRKSRVRTAEKKLIKAVVQKDAKSIPELLKSYVSEATRAVSKGALKKQTVSRKVSRLSVKANQALATK
ncbi:MAG: 30S ribosomal protein S20 [Bdellovibrionaceae bacterium]|nr:30S ribosomal protein S20 [Pseudobdellovibrionaceae bacterium]